MLHKLILGRYIPRNSIMHSLDARAKLITGFAFMGILFLANNWQTYTVLLLFTYVAILCTGISIRTFIRGIRPILWMILFTVMFQVLFISGGEIYATFGPITISSLGIVQGVFVFCRFVLMIVMTTVITLTTTPIDVTDAIQYILSPLTVMKVPVQDISLMISIALRFIPTLMDETVRIMDAQKARGVEFGEGNVFEQMKKIVPIFIPLFVSSFYRAEELANAMDARGYQGGRGRTKLRILQWRGRDTVLICVYMLLIVGLLRLRT